MHSAGKHAGKYASRAARYMLGTGLKPHRGCGSQLDALRIGFWQREHVGQDLAGLTHHSARGAIRCTERLDECAAVASVRSRGDSFDNMMSEAQSSLYKAELVRNPTPGKRSTGSRSRPLNGGLAERAPPPRRARSVTALRSRRPTGQRTIPDSCCLKLTKTVPTKPDT